MSATAESKRRELIVRFIGEPDDSDAEWQTLSERFVPHLASRLDEYDIALTAQRVRLDTTLEVATLAEAGSEDAAHTVWIVVLGAAYGHAASPRQLETTATALSDTRPPSVLDLVLGRLLQTPDARRTVHVYEREWVAGEPQRDSRLKLLADRIRELASAGAIAAHRIYQERPVAGNPFATFGMLCAYDLVATLRQAEMIDEQTSFALLEPHIVSTPYLELPFNRIGVQFAAEIEEGVFARGSRFVLAVGGTTNTEALRQRIETQAKVSSVADMPRLMNVAGRGVGLRYLDFPPAEVPRSSGYDYYELDVADRRWTGVKETGSLAFYLADAEANLDARLFVVLSDERRAAQRHGERLENVPKPRVTLGADADVCTGLVDENVQFTVYRPRRIAPSRWYPVLAFAHLAERRPDAPDDAPDPVEEVARQAHQALGEQASEFSDATADSRQAIPHESELSFVLDLPQLRVNPKQRSFRWVEDVHREEFRVMADARLDRQTVRGVLTAYLGSIIVAEVSLAIRVDSLASGVNATTLETSHARPYRNIFPSYSHQDTWIVRHLERFVATLGDRYLRDATTLRAGEVWSDRLRELIAQADVFQLFWSRHSMFSPFVRQEWEYALSLRRPNFIRPTYWDEPMPTSPAEGLPPPALKALHFQRLPLGDKPVVRAPPAAPSPPLAEPQLSPPPKEWRRRVLRIPTAVAALFFVGFVGASLMWLQRSMGPLSTASPVATNSLQAISADGTLLASMDADGRIQVAARAGGDPLVIATRFRPSDVAAMRFSADGSRIVCELRDGSVVEWDARTGTRIAARRRRVGSTA